MAIKFFIFLRLFLVGVYVDTGDGLRFRRALERQGLLVRDLELIEIDGLETVSIRHLHLR